MTEKLTFYHIMVQLMRELKVMDLDCIDTFIDRLGEKTNDSTLSEMERQKMLESIVKNCDDPQKFIRLFEQLKTNNFGVLDHFLQLIYMTMHNPKIKSFISSQSKHKKQKFMNLSSLQNTLQKLKFNTSESFSVNQEIDVQKEAHTIPIIENMYLDRSRNIQSIKEALTKCDTTFLHNKASRDQELLVIEDLIFSLFGFNGRFIYFNEKINSFTIDKYLNDRIFATVERIIPLLSARRKITLFLEKYPPCVGNLVQQAFSHAVYLIEHEFISFFCEVEEIFRKGELNLQKLLYIKESCIEEIEFVGNTCFQLQDCNNSYDILSNLHEKLKLAINNGVCLKTCGLLISTASQPYFDMIAQWIYHGIIKDPYNEFMISTNTECSFSKIYSRDQVWECLHILDISKIPVFLKPVSDKIFNAGRYLNVLSQCGVLIKNTVETPLLYNYCGNEYYKHIDSALSNASKTLLDYIIVKKRFTDFLKSIRHFFLLDHGDFFTIFIDLTEHILIKPRTEIEISKLESLLELAIRQSVFNNDSFSDHVGIILLEEDLETHQLQILGNSYQTNIIDSDGIRSLAFTFFVDFPFSLIINSMTITKYQMIFRHLLYIKYCSHILSRHWQTVSKLYAHSKCLNYRKNLSFIQIVTNKMLHFLQNFEYFIQNDVINPNWNILMIQISNSESLDELIIRHDDFLAKTLKDCMLTHSKLVEGFSNIINLCYNFPNSLLKFTYSLDSYDCFEFIERYHEQITESVSSFIYFLYGKHSDHFEHNMLTLVERLDFNNFYSKSRSNISRVDSSTSSLV